MADDAALDSVVDTTTDWFNVRLPVKQCSLKELANFTISKEQLDETFQEAQRYLDEETTKFSGGDRRSWYLSQFQARGTVADRVAAAALKLSGPDLIFHLEGFTLLFDTARNDSHHYDAALKALGAIWPKLLPPRPLKRFAAQYFATLPNSDPRRRRKVLLYWYLEDTLKRTYSQFLALAESCLKDRLVARRDAWLDTCGKLLNTVTESCAQLIAMVVDKLGDPASTVAHKAYHLLLGMLCESSSNQTVLLQRLESLVFTKNCPLRTQKYAVNVMNQLVFSREERKLALKCVQTYLALFRAHAIQGTIDHTITNAIIVGLRRAFPYGGADFNVLSEHIDALFLLTHTGTGFVQRASTLALIQTLVQKGCTKLEDRYYRALYSLLLASPKQLPHSTQLAGYFTMLYKTVRQDRNAARVCAFVHRLLQRCMFNTDAYACAALMLVSETARAHVEVRRLIQRPAGDAPVGARDKERYDTRCRDPQYAKAQNECLWVLGALQTHTHPSVVKLVSCLLRGEEPTFDIHPLDDLTLMNFLQMFVETAKSEVGEDPASRVDAHGNRLVDSSAENNRGVPVFRRAVHVTEVPSLADENFIHASPNQVDAAALFLHRYAHQRQRFLSSKGQLRTTWGEPEEEEDEAAAEGDEGAAETAGAAHQRFATDDALFGPDPTKIKSKRGKKATVEGVAPRKTTVADVEEEEEGDAANGEEDNDSFDWGDGSSGYSSADDEDDEAAFAAAANRVLGKKQVGKKRGRNDDGAGDDVAIDEALNDSRTTNADAFDSVMEHHKEGPSKKKQRQEEWVDRRARGSGQGPQTRRGGHSNRGRA